MGIRKVLQTSRNLIRQYGTNALFYAISNKMHGRDLLYNIAEGYILHTKDEYDSLGNEVLLDQQNEISLDEQRKQINEFLFLPLISVIMPVYNAPVPYLAEALNSLQKQSYTNWELCVVDDGSKDGRGRFFLKQEQKQDHRIHFQAMHKNGGISSASNAALTMAKGEYIALLDQDDKLTPDALFWAVKAINEDMTADVLYSDECKVTSSKPETLTEFYFKPAWSPELLIDHMYIGHLTVYKTEIVRKVGGFRSEYDFSQDYDLALRVTEQTQNIRHIERILYYWRMLPTSGAAGGKDYARLSNMSALADAFKRRNINVVPAALPYTNYAYPVLKTLPLVSVVIPSDSTKMLTNCIHGLIGEATSYKNIEIFVVTNSKTGNEVKAQFPFLSNLNICAYDKLYNFSDKCNEGAKMAKGEFVLFYNDDVFPSTRDWLERLVEVFRFDGVGGVSPLLLYENGSIQYAGMVSGVSGQIGTSFNAGPGDYREENPFNHFLMRNVSVLSGACMLMRRADYLDFGGMDAEHTPTGHSDVDISFKILEHGLRCVYTPHSVMTHIGYHSWAAKNKKEKAEIYCLKRYGKLIADDPYFTRSMRRVYYREQCSNYEMYTPEKPISWKDRNRDILFVSHDLTLTGAPIVLMDAVRTSLRNGDYPVVVSPVDGPLRKKYLELGVTVIVDASAAENGRWFECFAKNFDLVVVNTLACTEPIRFLSGSLPPVLWWLHEGNTALDIFKDRLPKQLERNIHLYSASEYTQRLLDEYSPVYASGILRLGVRDISSDYENAIHQSDKVTFLIAGSQERRKGQDILIHAIEILPEKYQKRASFHIVGRKQEKHIVDLLE